MISVLRSATFSPKKERESLRVQQGVESLKTTQNPAERKIVEDWLANEKPNMERMAADEQRLQSREIDADTQLRAEQAKLADLQDQFGPPRQTPRAASHGSKQRAPYFGISVTVTFATHGPPPLSGPVAVMVIVCGCVMLAGAVYDALTPPDRKPGSPPHSD